MSRDHPFSQAKMISSEVLHVAGTTITGLTPKNSVYIYGLSKTGGALRADTVNVCQWCDTSCDTLKPIHMDTCHEKLLIQVRLCPGHWSSAGLSGCTIHRIGWIRTSDIPSDSSMPNLCAVTWRISAYLVSASILCMVVIEYMLWQLY